MDLRSLTILFSTVRPTRAGDGEGAAEGVTVVEPFKWVGVGEFTGSIDMAFESVFCTSFEFADIGFDAARLELATIGEVVSTSGLLLDFGILDSIGLLEGFATFGFD